MPECVTCTPEQIAEQRQQREQASKTKRVRIRAHRPKSKRICEVCGVEFEKQNTWKTCSEKCSRLRRLQRMKDYGRDYRRIVRRHKQEPDEEQIDETLAITKQQRQAVAQAAKRYERCRAEWDRCKSREDVASIRSELDAAERALARALNGQGLRVATVNGLRYRVDAVGELVRQEVVRAIHRSESTKTQKPAQEASRA